jgi:hypothetical protein
MVDVGERDRLAFIIAVLVNGLFSMNFSMFHIALRWANRVTLDIEIIFWVLFIAALIVANIWLYFRFL